MVNLSVSFINYKTLKDVDISLFKRFYLGYPFCLKKSGSFLTEYDHLEKTIKELKAADKEVFLVTPALMQTSDFNHIEKTLDFAISHGLDGIEINDVGMYVLAKKWPDLKILSGFFTNVYHPEAAVEYIKAGATTVLAHPELMYEELKEIVSYVMSSSGHQAAEAGIAVYGNLPLGVAYDCYLMTLNPDNKCKQQCSTPHYFDNNEFKMRSVGTANLMAADFCLLEHISKLIDINANYWRLETYLYDADKINLLGQAFNGCINGDDPSKYIDKIKNLAPNGLCDGWFVGKSGHSYSGKEALSHQPSAVSKTITPPN